MAKMATIAGRDPRPTASEVVTGTSISRAERLSRPPFVAALRFLWMTSRPDTRID